MARPAEHLSLLPDRAAVVMVPHGEVVTYRQLDERSNRLAHLLRGRGLRRGDHIAILLENHPRYFEVIWAAFRSGLYVTPINSHLGGEEAGYVIEDCGARALVTSVRLAQLVADIGPYLARVETLLAVDGHVDGFERYEEALEIHPSTPIDDESDGAWMLYSSGTTGRPKGIKTALRSDPPGTATGLELLLRGLYGIDQDSRYLCPAPLYHAAPLGWSVAAQRMGCSVVVMERFDAEDALSAIDRYGITHAQFVPTHFIRMLKLPEESRRAHDHSSLQVVVHAAAPCPVEVKRAMLQWWGPIIYEYYAGSEGTGFCAAGPEEWMAHPGTVGKPILGTVHILEADGLEVERGETGQIWFESNLAFEYHNDPAKTAAAFNDRGWSTLGDIGYVDKDGFVFLTDRASDMIISGGVNIYPREVENLILTHPGVADVAVIGVPDDDLGEAVKAVVQPAVGTIGDVVLAADLIAYCRRNLAGFKCPRTIDFDNELPRLQTGKLLKRVIRERYADEGQPV